MSVVKDVQRDSNIDTDESREEVACRGRVAQGSNAAAPARAESAHSPTRSLV